MNRFIFFSTFLTACFSFGELQLTDRVIDDAHVLTSAEIDELKNLLKTHEENTSNQLVILTINSLEGISIEEFAINQARAWKLGDKNKNNGVLLIVAPHDRKVRIEVGYGLEEILTDAKSKVIIERDMVPYFKSRNFGQGILQGTQAIINVINTNEPATMPDDSFDFWVLLFFLGFIAFFIWLHRLGKKRGPGSGRRPPPFLGGGFSNRGSHGGFSGGGGSFGGGGASGRW